MQKTLVGTPDPEPANKGHVISNIDAPLTTNAGAGNTYIETGTLDFPDAAKVHEAADSKDTLLKEALAWSEKQGKHARDAKDEVHASQQEMQAGTLVAIKSGGTDVNDLDDYVMRQARTDALFVAAQAYKSAERNLSIRVQDVIEMADAFVLYITTGEG